MDDSGGFRVHGLQFCVHGFRAVGFQFSGQLLAQTIRGFFGGEAHPVQKALHIQSGAAYQQRQMPPGSDILDILPCQRGEIRHAVRRFRREEIQQVMRYPLPLLRGRFCRAYV